MGRVDRRKVFDTTDAHETVQPDRSVRLAAHGTRLPRRPATGGHNFATKFAGDVLGFRVVKNSTENLLRTFDVTYPQEQRNPFCEAS